MNGLIVSGHGMFASGLHSSVKLIAGDQPQMEYVDFKEGDSTADLEKNLTAALENLRECESVLFLCDIVGGSPFKTAVSLSAAFPNTAVVGGANLGMVIETAIMKDNFSLEELKDFAINVGKEAIKSFQKSERPKRNGVGI